MIFLQRTFTSSVNAHVGRTQGKSSRRLQSLPLLAAQLICGVGYGISAQNKVFHMHDLLTSLGSALIAFLVAWVTVRAEESKGRALLYSLCCRFFIAAFNSIDPQTNKLKANRLEKRMYQAELEAILDDVSGISTNSVFVRFLSRNQFVPQMMVQIRRELEEHKESSTFAMNQGTIQHFITTFDWCKKWPWGFWIRKHKHTEELVDFFRKWIEGSQQYAPADARTSRG